jgi:hypothetical protein
VIPEKRFRVKLTRPTDNDINVEMLCLALKGLLRTVPQNAISVSNSSPSCHLRK